ncbi:MAG: PEP-utilizing enzyme [Ardenticatenia bacterium]|nr:PEP-utilizing enzyme [Ardenticatenia bacterium]
MPLCQQPILWLDEPEAGDEGIVGAKAARLARLRRQGMLVPNGFVVLPDTDPRAPGVRRAFEALVERGTSRVVVRSSALAEDGEEGSFAGQLLSVSDIASWEAFQDALERVRASALAAHVRAYSGRIRRPAGPVAVLVQRQVIARVSGVAFGEHPITGEPIVVVEAVPGNESATSGEAWPHTWHVRPRPGAWAVDEPFPPSPPVALPVAELKVVALFTLLAGHLFGQPQDVEWAWDGEHVWVLQARSITARREEDFFTERLPDDQWLWTAAFLNERFHAPVSPLGWSLVAELVEALALRAPLRLLGADDVQGPLLKLWRGHPYSRVEAWQRIYKLFPDALLPEDAARYFPGGDVTLRRAPRRPTWGLHLFLNGLAALWTSRRGASPWHNPAAWDDFERRLEAWMRRFTTEEALLPHLPAEYALETSRQLLQEAQALAGELLELHRWSLLYAEVGYTLLRRLLWAIHGKEEGSRYAAEMTANVPSKTLALNRALRRLAAQAARRPEVMALLGSAHSLSALARALGHDDPFVAAATDFFVRYGHRFFSLDLADPPYEAAPHIVFELIRAQAETHHAVSSPPTSRPCSRPPVWLRPLVHLVREYSRLREDQRFAWQRLLAFQRRVALHVGARWTEAGRLSSPEEVFGLTLEEVLNAPETAPVGEWAARRLRRWHALRRAWAEFPGWHYPDFLRGHRPLVTEGGGTVWVGRPVSPGVARGPARVVRSPAEFQRVRAGDILVAPAVDPGWTVLFERVAGLVTERGGQLSHAAVVAREYGLPAVAGAEGIVASVREGEELIVDGTQGVVVRPDVVSDGRTLPEELK